MFRKIALTVCLTAVCIWCLALETGADSGQHDHATRAFKPVASVDALMHGQLVFFKAIGAELEKPASADRNHEIEEAAQVLAELANVNRFNSEKGDYIGWATEVRDGAMKLAAEAKKKDASNDRLTAYVTTIKGKCGACHDAYQ